MKLPTELPIRYRYPGILRNTLLAVAVVLALYGFFWSIVYGKACYLLYVEADERVERANANVELAFEILRGERPVVTEDGTQVARVIWEKVKLVNGVDK